MIKTIELYSGRIFKTLLVPLLVYIVFAALSGGRFGTWLGMTLIARQAVISALLALGITCNMVMGMWDFSAGAVVVFAAIIGGNLAKATGLDLFGLILFCVLTAVLMTTLTGFLYSILKVPSMVFTIGLVLVYETLPYLVYDGAGAFISGNLTKLARSPYCFIILGVMFAIFYIIFNYTTFGHNVRAYGRNSILAKNLGLNPTKIKFFSFVLGGAFLGMAAVIYISSKGKIQVGASMSSVTMVFDAMMGFFIAIFLSRYCNMAIGIVIGSFTMKMLTAGLVSLGLSTTIRNITTGLFLLVLLCISSNMGRVSAWRARRERAKQANIKYLKAKQC
ncbi:MAG: ABC transporter permease [Firmicutes bacterium]|nr:ABC transporter permease [Bacillota bacterium]